MGALVRERTGENEGGPACVRGVCAGVCWGRSSRGGDCWLICEQDLGNQRLLTFLLFPQGSLERNWCHKTIWMVYVGDLSSLRPLYQLFKILAGGCGDLVLWCPSPALWVSSLCLLNYQPPVCCGFLSRLPMPSVYGASVEFYAGAPSLQAQCVCAGQCGRAV